MLCSSVPITEISSVASEFCSDLLQDSLEFCSDLLQDSLEFCPDLLQDSLEFCSDLLQDAPEFCSDLLLGSSLVQDVSTAVFCCRLLARWEASEIYRKSVRLEQISRKMSSEIRRVKGWVHLRLRCEQFSRQPIDLLRPAWPRLDWPKCWAVYVWTKSRGYAAGRGKLSSSKVSANGTLLFRTRDKPEGAS